MVLPKHRRQNIGHGGSRGPCLGKQTQEALKENAGETKAALDAVNNNPGLASGSGYPVPDEDVDWGCAQVTDVCNLCTPVNSAARNCEADHAGSINHVSCPRTGNSNTSRECDRTTGQSSSSCGLSLTENQGSSALKRRVAPDRRTEATTTGRVAPGAGGSPPPGRTHLAPHNRLAPARGSLPFLPATRLTKLPSSKHLPEEAVACTKHANRTMPLWYWLFTYSMVVVCILCVHVPGILATAPDAVHSDSDIPDTLAASRDVIPDRPAHVPLTLKTIPHDPFSTTKDYLDPCKAGMCDAFRP